jgi:hypothetical protein
MILIDSNFFIVLFNIKISYKKVIKLLPEIMKEKNKTVPLLMFSEAIISVNNIKNEKWHIKLIKPF